MKCTFLDDILIDKINAIQQMGVIVEAHYTGEEYDNTLKLVFTDDAGQTVAIIVATELNYSYQYTVELHGHALKAFGKCLQKRS